VSNATGLTNTVALAAGVSHTCALRADGRVFCWGRNNVGQLGRASAGSLSNTPVQVEGLNNQIGGLNSVTTVAAGGSHNCALFSTGQAACWGNNAFGQLANGSNGGFSDTPLLLGGGLIDAVGLNAGGIYTCALRVLGRVICWGDNTFGQLGIGNAGGLRDSPIAVSTASGLIDATAVSAGGAHACALRADGAVFCWGSNESGQIGTGSSGDLRPRPFEVPSFRFNVDPNVALKGHGRVAVVTALVNCPAGDKVHVRVELTQDGTFGQGHAVRACTGGLERYPVTVPAHGWAGFEPGPAQAAAEAVVRDRGQVTETQAWTRAVELVP
jgi:alpha-tubulin suppressor-like RCC1 family protein